MTYAADRFALIGELKAAGGLHRLTTVGRMIGVSRSRAHELVARPDFPPPVMVDGVRHWTGLEVTAWQASIGRRRRPGKTVTA